MLALKLSQIGGRNGALLVGAEGAEASRRARTDADFFAAASGADTLDDTDLVDLGALMRRLTDRPAGQAGTDELREPHCRADRNPHATIARRASGNLAGRDGLSVQVELASSASGARDPPATGRRVAAKQARTTARPAAEAHGLPGAGNLQPLRPLAPPD